MLSFCRLAVCCLSVVLASLQAMAQSVQLPYKQVDVKNVNGTAVFSGASLTGEPGQPALPSYVLSFVLPPDVEFSGVSVSLDNPLYQDLIAKYEVAPEPPIRRDDGSLQWPKGANIADGRDMSIYGINAFFPNDFKGQVSMGPMRQYNLVHIRIYPYLYNSVTKKLRKLSGGTLRVSLSGSSSVVRSIPREDWVEQMFLKTVVNPEALESYGIISAGKSMSFNSSATTLSSPAVSAAATANNVAGFGYLIFSPTYIWDNSVGLNNYKQHLQNLGAIVTRYDDVQMNPTGNLGAKDKSANVRFWIVNWYNQCLNQGISPKYVLLVGNPDTADADSKGNQIKGQLPMYVWTWPDYARVPTDWYYTDLSATWDSDMSAWVALGRIPVYITDTRNDIGNLDAYISTMYNYSMASGADVEWRRNIYAVAEPYGFGNDQNVDNFVTLENVVSPLLSIGWTATRSYNPYVQYADAPFFINPPVVNMSPLPDCIYPSGPRFASTWMSETPGILVWATHGGSDGACGIICTDPNNKDGYYSFPQLNNSHPAMVVAASCHTSDPCFENNLGTRMLFANAITYIGATISPAGGNDPWQSYSYYTGVRGFCAADAWNAVRANDQCPPIGISYNLYGCPEAALNLPYASWVPAPQNLKAEALSFSQIKISWDVIPNAATYYVQRSTDFSVKRTGFSDIATITNGGTVMSYTDINLYASMKYKYRICYVPAGSVDRSGYSKIDSACTWNRDNTNPVPPAPSTIGATPGSNCASLSWSSVAGAASYNLKRATSSSGPFVTIMNTTATSFLDSNLMNNTTYYYAVASVTQSGQSGNSAAAVARPTSNISGPNLIGVISGASYQVHYLFSPAAPNKELGFHFRGTLKFPDGSYYGGFNVLNNPRRRSTGDWYSNLATNSSYGFCVSAANDIADPLSNIYSFKTPSNPNNQVTIQPTELTAVTSGPSNISLNWKFTGTGTCDKTQIFYKLSDGTWQQTDVLYPGASAVVPRFTQIFIRAVKNRLAGEPDGAYACSDFTSGALQYEAENATLSGGAKKNTNHTGYSGTGFVDGFYNVAGPQVLFNVSVSFAGTYSLRLRYSAGIAASTNTGLYVNGTKIKNITCPKTANWDTWADEVETVTLNAGNNTIAYKAETASTNSINLDYVILSLKSALATYTITASAGANGSISPNGSISLNNGASQNYTITPNSGYIINNVIVDGVSQGTISSYTFIGVTSDHTISATFAVDPCSGIQGGGSGLKGATFGLNPPYMAGSEYCKATDANLNTFYEYAQPNGGYAGLDFGTAKVIGKIRYYPRSGLSSRMTGGKFQGSNTSNSSGFVDLYTISTTPPEQWNEVTISNSTAYRWVRYLSPNGGYGDIAEMEFYTTVANNPPTVATAAKATPSQVTGTTTALSVLGADDGGEPNLIYNWAATTVPSGGSATFSVNGTNAAKNCTATFTKAGSYTLTCTIKDAGNLTVTSSVNVTVNQTLTSIVVSPASATVNTSATQQFTATARDQFTANLTTQPTFAWTVSGGGTISSSGLFTAGSTAGGPYTVTASSGGKSGTASVTVAAQSIKVEAENATLAGSAYKATDHTGYSGTGFIAGYYNSTTAKVTYTVNVATAGSYKVTLRFSAGNGTSTNTGLYVNSTTKLKNISCTGTTNWNTWANEQETVTLSAGNNTIAYKAETSSGSCINLDYITVSK